MSGSDFKLGKRTAIAILIIAAVTIPTVAILATPTGMEGVQVYIYTDRGIRATSQIALEHMFRWMRADVSIIESEDINEGILDTCDILVMPGGCWCDERCELLDDEMPIIRDFIAGGGSYFGIDGGASYATSFRLGIFNGTHWPAVFSSETLLMEVGINRESSGPDLSAEPETYTMLYRDSGYYLADDMSDINPIATYLDTDFHCMISFKYGNGTVFLSSLQPEYEEGSDRDGTDAWDTMTDPDSEWPFMLKIARWLVEESVT